jgi:hypothetical protein
VDEDGSQSRTLAFRRYVILSAWRTPYRRAVDGMNDLSEYRHGLRPGRYYLRAGITGRSAEASVLRAGLLPGD